MLVGGKDVTDALEWSLVEQDEVSLLVPDRQSVHPGDEIRLQSREAYRIPLVGRLLLRFGYGRLVILGIFRVTRVDYGRGRTKIDGLSVAAWDTRTRFVFGNDE